MTTSQPSEIFAQIFNDYSEIKDPKYRNADLDILHGHLETLLQLKEYLEDLRTYNNLINGISQTIKHIEKNLRPDRSRSIITERGINKAIQPVINKSGHPVTYPFEWKYLKTNQICIINKGFWDAKNSMAMDIIGHLFLIKEGDGSFPKKKYLFENENSIGERESTIVTGSHDKPDIQLDIGTVKNQKYWVSFTDAEFRKYTSRDLTSIQIRDLLHDTADVEFKLVFPVRMDNGRNGKEQVYQMNYFSRFFEFGYADEERIDGIVRNRRYFVAFNTMLGELYVNNLLSEDYDWINKGFYSLPSNAQMFYKQFILNHSLTSMQLHMDKIRERLHLYDKNITNLIKTIEINVLKPLIEQGYIISYRKAEGLKGLKYLFRIPPKKKEKEKL